MITDQHREEALSCAYLQAVVGHAGHILRLTNGFDYGVDGAMYQVQEAGGRRSETGFSVHVQAKATVNWSEDGANILYDLDASTYNYLVERFCRSRANPIILVVLCLPKNATDWLNVNARELVMKHCCYWVQLSGKTTSNTSTKRIRIPKLQALTPEAVTSLLSDAEAGVLQ